MPEPILTEEELAALETLAAAGPERMLDKALRGRLALYKMIDETPSGWKITALGRGALSAARPRRDSTPAQTPGSNDEAASPGDGKRNYGRKSRDTSWLD